MVVTDRGTPIAVIKSLTNMSIAGKRVKAMEDQGLLVRAQGKAGAFPRLRSIKGKPLSRIVSDEQDER